MTIAEFLTARYDEDEAVALAAQYVPGSDEFGWADVDYNSVVAEQHGYRWKPERVLADVAAERAIVAHEARGYRIKRGGPVLVHSSHGIYRDREMYDRLSPDEVAAWQAEWTDPITDTPVLRLLALPHAGHEDYDEGWKP